MLGTGIRLCRNTTSPTALVLLVFVVLGVAYSVVTPLFEAPDDYAHCLFVRHLLRSHELPVLAPPPGHNVAGEEGGQAPLYYILGSAATWWAFTERDDEPMRPSPHGGPGYPDARGTKNIWLHSPREGFPYVGQSLAAHLLRLLSILFGAAGVCATLLAAREFWPTKRCHALAAAAVSAFNPQYISISSAITNDVLAASAGSSICHLVFKMLRRGCTLRLSITLGIALGCALLSKVSLLGMAVPAAAAVGFACVQQRRSIRHPLASLFAVVSLPLAIGGWWYLRNWQLYGDPFALTISALVAGGGSGSLNVAEIVPDLEGLLKSYWAVFGAFNIAADPALYALYDVLMVLAGIGLVGSLTLLVRQKRYVELETVAFLLLSAIATFAGLIRWRFLVLAFQGRLLFPVAGAVSILIIVGLAWLAPKKTTRLTLAGLAVLLAIPPIITPFRYLAPAYAKPQVLTSIDEARLPKVSPWRFEGKLELAAYDIPSSLTPQTRRLPIKLYWRGLSSMSEDYSLFVHLQTPEGRRVGQLDTFPGQGMFPTSQWPPETAIKVEYAVPLFERSDQVGTILVVAGVYSVGSGRRLGALSSSGVPAGDQVIPGKLIDRSMHQTSIPLVVFSDRIALIDYQLDTRDVPRGGTVRGTLVWRAERKPEKNYTVFVHLVSPDGLLAQYDSQPVRGRYPSTMWDQAETVRDSFAIEVPTALPPARYVLIVGLYDLDTGQRLSTGESTYLVLGTVGITE